MSYPKERGHLRKYISTWWVLTNWGNPIAVHSSRRDAIGHCERYTGKDWKEARAFMEVRKVKLVEIR